MNLSELPGELFIHHIFEYLSLLDVCRRIIPLNPYFERLGWKSLKKRKKKLYGCEEIFLSLDVRKCRRLIEMDLLDFNYDGEDLFDELKKDLVKNKEKLDILIQHESFELNTNQLEHTKDNYGVELASKILFHSTKPLEWKIKTVLTWNKMKLKEKLHSFLLLMKLYQSKGDSRAYRELRRNLSLHIMKNVSPRSISKFLTNPVLTDQALDSDFFMRSLRGKKQAYEERKKEEFKKVIRFMIQNHKRIPSFEPSGLHLKSIFLNEPSDLLRLFLEHTDVAEKYTRWNELLSQREKKYPENFAVLFEFPIKTLKISLETQTEIIRSAMKSGSIYSSANLLKIICSSSPGSSVGDCFAEFFKSRFDYEEFFLRSIGERSFRDCLSLLENNVVRAHFKKNLLQTFDHIETHYCSDFAKDLLQIMDDEDILHFQVFRLLLKNEDIICLDYLLDQRFRKKSEIMSIFIENDELLITLLKEMFSDRKITGISCLFDFVINVDGTENQDMNAVLRRVFPDPSVLLAELFQKLNWSREEEEKYLTIALHRCLEYSRSYGSSEYFKKLWDSATSSTHFRNESTEQIFNNHILHDTRICGNFYAEGLLNSCRSCNTKVIRKLMEPETGTKIPATYENFLVATEYNLSKSKECIAMIVELLLRHDKDGTVTELGTDGRVFENLCQIFDTKSIFHILDRYVREDPGKDPFGGVKDRILSLIFGFCGKNLRFSLGDVVEREKLFEEYEEVIAKLYKVPMVRKSKEMLENVFSLTSDEDSDPMDEGDNSHWSFWSAYPFIRVCGEIPELREVVEKWKEKRKKGRKRKKRVIFRKRFLRFLT